jgi:hypothetical protein
VLGSLPMTITGVKTMGAADSGAPSGHGGRFSALASSFRATYLYSYFYFFFYTY